MYFTATWCGPGDDSLVIKTLPNDDHSRLSRIGASGGDVPITLKDACRDVFKDKISVATLMAEHRRGNLVIYKIGRQYFTSLNELNAMLANCRVQVPSRIILERQQTDAERQRHAQAAQMHLRQVIDRLTKKKK